MLPSLALGPWQISTYKAVGIVAVMITGRYIYERLLKLGQPPGRIGRCLLLGAVFGYALAYAVLFLGNRLRPSGSEPQGLSIIWGLVGVCCVAAACCWRYKVSLGRVLDLVVLPAPLGQAIGRLGCLAVGCCYGRPTDSWLGIYLPDEQGVWLARYPTQLLSAAADLSIFCVLLVVERVGQSRVPEDQRQTWPFNGFLALLYIVLFSLKRFAIAFLRASAVPVLGPFSSMHLLALAGLFVATALILWNLNRSVPRQGGYVVD